MFSYFQVWDGRFLSGKKSDMIFEISGFSTQILKEYSAYFIKFQILGFLVGKAFQLLFEYAHSNNLYCGLAVIQGR